MIELKTELYRDQTLRLPSSGQRLIGQTAEDTIVFYQAFNSTIADYAVKNQKFGGSAYSYTRMSWIKPNFLWMMYRCGWAEKENQERVLAIWVPREKVELILSKAVHSAFNPEYYDSELVWKEQLSCSEVRLQWDPDHDPFGSKLERRAIQLGLKGEILRSFAAEWIVKIEDITLWIKAEAKKVFAKDISGLVVPKEDIIVISSKDIRKRVGIEE